MTEASASIGFGTPLRAKAAQDFAMDDQGRVRCAHFTLLVGGTSVRSKNTNKCCRCLR